MKKRVLHRLISAILMAFWLVNAIPINVGAASDEYLDLADIIGENYKIRRTIDFEPGMDADSAGMQGHTVTENGLELSASVMSGKWTYTAYPAPMGNPGDAVEMRIKTSGEGFQIIIYDSNGGRVFTKLQAGENGCWFNVDGSAIYKTTDDPLNKWITVLFVNNENGFDMYYKKDGESGYKEPFFSGTSKRSGDGHIIELLANNNGQNYVDYVKMYKHEEKMNTLDELIGAHNTFKTIDFSPEMNKDSAGANGYTITKDGLKLSGDVKNGEWILPVTPAPMGNPGDAVEMRIKTSGEGFQVIMFDSTGGRIYFKLENSIGGSWFNEAETALYAKEEDLFNQWITILMVNYDDGYGLYYKTDEDTRYGEALFRGTSKRAGNGTTIGIYANNSGTNYVDYIKLYRAKEVDYLKKTIGKYSVLKTIDFEPGMDVVDTGTSGHILTEDGLKLSSAQKNGTWTYTSNPAPMGNPGDAVEMRIKTSGEGLQIIAYDSTGGRVYTSLKAGTDGCRFNIDGSALYKTTDELFNKWINLLFVNRGTGFDMYYKTDDEKDYGEPFFRGTSKDSGNNSTIGIYANNSGIHYVDYIKMYQHEEKYTLNDLIGYHDTYKTINFVPDMDRESAGTTGYTLTENGLELSVADNNGAWEFMTETAPMGSPGDAVEMRIKTNGEGIQFVLFDSTGGRIYFYLAGGKNGCWFNEAQTAIYATEDDLFNQWITVLMVNYEDGYGLYYKTDEEKKYGEPFFRGTSKKEGYGSTIGIYAKNYGTHYIDYIKLYHARNGYNLTELLGEHTVRQTIDFESGMDAAAIGAEGYSITENGLELSSANKNGEWSFMTNPAPMGNAGDAMEMRVKTSGKGFRIIGYDATGGKLYTMLQAGNNGCWFNEADTAIYKTSDELFNRWINIIFVNTGNGFKMYYKPDGEEKYRDVFFKGESKRTGVGKTIEISANNDGENYIDYIRLYDGANDKILLTDGNDADTEVEYSAVLTNPDKIRAVVLPETTGVLAFAGYNNKGTLVDVMTENVAYSGGTTIYYDAKRKADIDKVKVFVFDDLLTLRPITDKRMVRVTEYVTDNGSFFDDFTNEDLYGKWHLRNGTWKIQGNALKSNHRETSEQHAWREATFENDFVFETSFRHLKYAQDDYVQLSWEGGCIRFHIKEDHLEVHGDASGNNAVYSSEELNLGNDWHTYRVETSDSKKYFSIFVDDVKVIECPVENDVEWPCEPDTIMFSSTCASADTDDWEVNYVKLTPKDTDSIIINSAIDGGEYTEGGGVTLTAALKEGISSEAVPYIDYKQFGKTVATGYAPNYIATLSDLCAGAYRVTANYNELKSNAYNYKVCSAVDGELEVHENGNSFNVSLTLCDSDSQTAEVEFLADGITVGISKAAPYSVTAPALSDGAHIISAVCKTADGIVLNTITDTKTIATGNPNNYTGYSNEIKYNVTGNNGDVTLSQSNGRHTLSLKHTAVGICYQTDEGEKLYNGGVGTGSYKILTDGPYAEVYRNGQLAMGFIMPRTEECGHSIKENGLSISEFDITAPENRRSYFKGCNLGAQKHTYKAPQLSYVHNIDFLADKNDNAKIAVDDGYYHTELTLRDGKLYALNSKLDRSMPEEIYLADIPETDKDIYFRVKTSAGMSELYGNGKYMGTFRGVSAVGSETVSVDISEGSEIKYLSVCDATDIYIYEEAFDGSGEFNSLDYWRIKGITEYIDNENALMTLRSDGTDMGFCEMNVSAGEAYAEADVSVKECSGGIWFIYNHNSTNIYSIAGYNYEAGRFEIVDNFAGKITTYTANGTLPQGEKVRMALDIKKSEKGKRVALYVNGNAVISADSDIAHNGRIGIALKKGVADMDSFRYRGDSKPYLGVSETMPGGVPSLDMFETDTELVLMNDANTLRSSDGGKTWKIQAGKAYDSFNIVRLKSGKLLSMYRRTLGTAENGLINYDYLAMISEDNGESWTQQSTEPVIEDEYLYPGIYVMQNRIRQGSSGRIYFSTEAKSDANQANENYGATRLFYSDDEGKTWTASQTRIGYDETGMSIQEATTMELPDGTVRTYARTDRGYLVYFESKDGGATFDVTPRKTPFTSVMCSFNIEYDPQDSNIHYLAWVYDNANLDGRNQFRRQRVAVARSTDGGNTWDYLGTIFEWNTDIARKINIMNTDINVGRDYLVLNWWSQEDLNTNYISRVITVKKDTLQPTKRFEQLHLANLHNIETAITAPYIKRDRTMVVNSVENTVLLHGNRVENAAFDNSILLACAASFVGAKIENGTNGSVVLKCGNSEVTFGADRLILREGKQFISLEEFLGIYGLSVETEGNISIVSEYSNWSPLQRKAFLFAIN